jgi:flagellar M-ring protein FliF
VTEAPGGGDGAVSRLSQTRNWEVDKVSQKTTTPPGTIQRLSVAVLVNDHVQRRGNQWSSQPRTTQELAQIEELVKRAVGYSVDRGDSVHVSAASFARLDTEIDGPSKSPSAWKRWLPYIVAGGAVLLLALVVLVWRSNRSKARRPRTAALAGHSLQAGELAAQLKGSPELAGLPGSAVASSEGRNPSHKLDGPLLRAKALQLASEDPATAAIVIRNWLNAGVNSQTTVR